MQRQVSFGEAIRMAIVENYCCFTGRSSRSEYWWYTLFCCLLVMAIGIIFDFTSETYQIVSAIVSLALLLPGLGLFVRRLHDIGKSGWWYFINFIPLVGSIILLVWLCKPSDPGDNAYGPEPNVI